jgi:hypothetical protein
MLFHSLLGLVCIIATLFKRENGWPSDTAAFSLMLAALFSAVAAGLRFRVRWLVIVPAIPLLAASLLAAVSLVLLSGPPELIICGVGMAALEVASIVVGAQKSFTAQAPRQLRGTAREP